VPTLLKPIDRERTKRKQAERKIKNILATFLEDNKESILAPLIASYKPQGSTKAADPDIEALVNKLLLELDVTAFEDLPPELQAEYEKLIKDGMLLTVRQLSDKLSEEDFNNMFRLVNTRAVEMAKTQVGLLIKNFADTTPEMLRADVSQALMEGWTNRELANVLMDNRGFSKIRAEMIARTETASMDVASNVEMWKESGVVVGKQWLLSSDPCDDCIENSEVGIIGLDEEFPNGECPVHPNCSCDESAVLED
jgi:hypothetical protein